MEEEDAMEVSPLVPRMSKEQMEKGRMSKEQLQKNAQIQYQKRYAEFKDICKAALENRLDDPKYDAELRKWEVDRPGFLNTSRRFKERLHLFRKNGLYRYRVIELQIQDMKKVNASFKAQNVTVIEPIEAQNLSAEDMFADIDANTEIWRKIRDSMLSVDSAKHLKALIDGYKAGKADAVYVVDIFESDIAMFAKRSTPQELSGIRRSTPYKDTLLKFAVSRIKENREFKNSTSSVSAPAMEKLAELVQERKKNDKLLAIILKLKSDLEKNTYPNLRLLVNAYPQLQTVEDLNNPKLDYLTAKNIISAYVKKQNKYYVTLLGHFYEKKVRLEKLAFPETRKIQTDRAIEDLLSLEKTSGQQNFLETSRQMLQVMNIDLQNALQEMNADLDVSLFSEEEEIAEPEPGTAEAEEVENWFAKSDWREKLDRKQKAREAESKARQDAAEKADREAKAARAAKASATRAANKLRKANMPRAVAEEEDRRAPLTAEEEAELEDDFQKERLKKTRFTEKAIGCQQCGAPTVHQCADCKRVGYCDNSICQRLDWAQHSKVCCKN
jgi:MYND finger